MPAFPKDAGGAPIHNLRMRSSTNRRRRNQQDEAATASRPELLSVADSWPCGRPPETLAYVALLNPDPTGHDALAVLDVDPASPGVRRRRSRVSTCRAPATSCTISGGTPAARACARTRRTRTCERRYLVVPGMRSSRIHILDTEPDPRQPRIVKVIEADEVIRKTGYSRPHTSHCGPDGIYINALGDAEGNGPGGIFVLDPETFEIKGRWERDRGPQYLAYDFWWHLGHDTMITSEWGTPNMVEDGVNPELLLAGKYGNALHVWDLHTAGGTCRRWISGAEQQMVLELRPAHDPNETYGFAGVVTSLKDLSASIWMWYRDGAGKDAVARPEGDRDPRRAGVGRRSAAAAQGVRRRAAAGHRHQPLARRPVPLRVVLGHRRAEAVRRLGSVQPGRDRLGEARRDRPASARIRRVPDSR